MEDNDDTNALERVLPEDIETAPSYCRHIVQLFEKASLDEYVVRFSERAVDLSPTDEPTQDLWDKLFKSYVDLGLYEEAYAVMTSVPFRDM